MRRVMVVGLMGLALTAAACSSGGASSSSSTRAPSHSTPGGSGAAHSITIQNFAFSPKTITVAPGTTVTVTNKDQVTHTLTARNGGFNTGDISAGQSKTFTAPNNSGTYPYFCMIHQFMTGTLVVSG
ncbi:MAG: cupredoxin domain-containing protein [Acidimicrobiales bacterium]